MNWFTRIFKSKVNKDVVEHQYHKDPDFPVVSAMIAEYVKTYMYGTSGERRSLIPNFANYEEDLVRHAVVGARMATPNAAKQLCDGDYKAMVELSLEMNKALGELGLELHSQLGHRRH